MGPKGPARNALAPNAVAGPQGHPFGNVNAVEVTEEHFVFFAADIELSADPAAVTFAS
jgi:hypothetical protein